jgi:hypothetical protein
LVVPGGLSAQASEIEILGPAKTPFALILSDTLYTSSRANRLTTEPLESGKAALHIRFHDTRYAEIHDTVVLIPGVRHIFRLRKVALESSDSAADLGSYLKKKGFWVSKDEPVAMVLMPFEKVPASEKALARIEEPAADSVPLITHAPDILYTRDTLVRTLMPRPGQRADSANSETVVPVDDVTSAEILTTGQIRQLKARMKELRFEEDKIKLTHTMVGQKQLAADQLYEILMLFDFERSKMQLFKQYYVQLTDRSNLTRLYQAFEFSSTIDELKTWVYEQTE